MGKSVLDGKVNVSHGKQCITEQSVHGESDCTVGKLVYHREVSVPQDR